MTDNAYTEENKNKFKEIIGLTHREFQCVELLSNGNSAKVIAKKLNISYRTVEAHFSNIMHKLGCKNRYSILKIYFNNQIQNNSYKNK